MELSELKALGALPKSLKDVQMKGLNMVSIEEALKIAGRTLASEQMVTVNNPTWVATSKGRSPKDAAKVYSGDSGKSVGAWSKDGTFLLMRVVGEQLHTIKKYFFNKEETSMAGLNIEDTTKEMDAFSDVDLNQELGDVGGSEELKAPDESGKDKKVSQRQMNALERDAYLSAIRSVTSGVTVNDNTAAQAANRDKGRLMFYITKTDSTIKVGSSSKIAVDGNNRRLLKPEINPNDPELASFKEKGNYPKDKCQQIATLRLSESTPGKPVGVVVKTPVATEIQRTQDGDRPDPASAGSKDFITRILPYEAATAYLMLNYGNYIKESEDVLGEAGAGIVEFNYRVLIAKTADEKTGKKANKSRMTMKVRKDSRSSKNLVIRGNYFPAKLYETIDLASASVEQKLVANRNIANALKKKDLLPILDQKVKDSYKIDESNNVTSSSWIDQIKDQNGEGLKILKFDKKNDSDFISTIAVPARDKKVSDNGNVTFPFRYIEIGSESGNGPETKPEFKNLIKYSGLGKEEFLAKVNELAARRSSGSTSSNSIDPDVFYRATRVASVDTGMSQGLRELADIMQASKVG